MVKTTKIILLLTMLLLIVFWGLAYIAYPRLVWWFFKVQEITLNEDLISVYMFHRLLSSSIIALSALFIGAGTYIISKKRNFKETMIGYFVLIDVAVVAMIGWLAFLKFRFMKSVTLLQTTGSDVVVPLVYKINAFSAYELGIAASVAVLFVAWIYPAKFGE